MHLILLENEDEKDNSFNKCKLFLINLNRRGLILSYATLKQTVFPGKMEILRG